MSPHELQLSVEVTAAEVLVHYAVVNRSPDPLYVRNVYRRVPPSTRTDRNGNWQDHRAKVHPAPGMPWKPEWVVAGTANLHPVGNTVLLLHAMEHFPISVPFYQHPMELWSTLVRPHETRNYTIRLMRPLQQWEAFGGDVPQPAVQVRRAILRMEYAAGGLYPEVDGYPGMFRVQARRCLSAGFDLAEPLEVHPMIHSAKHPAANPPPPPPGLPPLEPGLPRGLDVKRQWDERYGRFD